jgi:hypothetical protein
MSNEKKQTAVDTLIVNFKESISYLESVLVSGNHELTKIQIKARLSQARYFLNYAIEAKEMEKEQIIDAYWDGGQDVPLHINTCEQYYNETYGGNK